MHEPFMIGNGAQIIPHLIQDRTHRGYGVPGLHPVPSIADGQQMLWWLTYTQKLGICYVSLMGMSESLLSGRPEVPLSSLQCM